MTKELPTSPSLAQLRKLVKELRKSHASGESSASKRIQEFHPKYKDDDERAIRAIDLAQRSAQLIIAREYGFESWPALRDHVEFLQTGKTRRIYKDHPEKQRDAVRFKQLVSACRGGDILTVKRIIQQSPTLINRTDSYRPPLHFAAVGGHAEIVAHLLVSGAQVPHPEEMHTGETSLVIAQTRGYDEIVRLLSAALDRGAPILPQGVTIPESPDPDQWREFLTADPTRIRVRGTEGNTALHGAVASRNWEFMAFLLDRGAEVDAVRDDGLRPIHLALYRNMHWITQRSDQADLARDLIAKGADYTITVAAAIGDVDRVRALLSQDPSLANDLDTCRKRPLSCAAERGDLPMIKMLLARGADPNLPEGMCCGEGYALWGAVDHNHLQCARLLLERGANPNAELDSSGNVYARCKSEKARQLVLSFGGRVNIITHVMREEVDVVERLLEEDPSLADDIFYVHHDLTGPVHEANFIKMFQTAFGYGANPAKCPAYVFRRALTDMPPVAEFLMDHGVSPNLAVHDVAQKGSVAGMELLIRKGADLEMRDEQYEATPLTCAARAGQLDMVKFLLSKGAKTRYPGDKAWSTPEFWAIKNGHKETVEMLRARPKA